MSTNPATLVRSMLSNISSTLYTVPAATTVIVTNIVLTNTAAVSAGVTIALNGVPILSGQSVPANGMLSFDLRQPLATTNVITGACDTNAVIACHIAGVTVQ